MKIILHLTLLLCYVCTSYAQNLIPYQKGNLYGFADLEGNIIIEPIYDEVTNFDNLLNLSTWFDKVSYSDKLASFAHVMLKGKWTIIDEQGQYLLPHLSDKKYTIKSIEGRHRRNYHADLPKIKAVKIKNETDRTWRLYNSERNELSDAIYQDQDPHPHGQIRSGFRRGNLDDFSIAQLIIDENQQSKKVKSEKLGWLRYGRIGLGYARDNLFYDLINIVNGSVELTQMKSIYRICPYYFACCDSDDNWFIYNAVTNEKKTYAYPLVSFHLESPSDKTGYVDFVKGNCSIEYIEVGQDENIGLLDNNSNLVLDTAYSRIGIYPNYFIAYKGYYRYDEKGQAFLFDDSGQAIEIPESQVLTKISDGYFIAKLKTGKFLLLNKNGQPVDDVEYDKLYPNDRLNNIRFEQGELAGFIDFSGETGFTFRCDELYYLHHNESLDYYTFKKSDKYGLVDSDGVVLFQAEYKDISLLSSDSNLFRLRNLNGQYGVGNMGGEILIPIKYDYLSDDRVSTDVKHIVCINNKKEVARYNMLGELVSKPVWRGRRDSKFGIAGMSTLRGTSQGTSIVNEHDSIISDTTYYSTRRYKLGDDYIVTGLLNKDGLVDAYNSKGKRIAKEVSIRPSSYQNDGIKYPVFIKKLNAIVVTEDKTQALVNLDGEYLIPPGKYVSINSSSKCITTTRIQDSIYYTTLYDTNLKSLTKEYLHFQFLQHRKRYKKVNANYILVAERQDKKLKYGVIDYRGKVVIPLIYDEAQLVNEGISLTQVAEHNKYSRYYNFKLYLEHEGLYDYYLGKANGSEIIEAIKGDYYITIAKDGQETSTLMEYQVENSQMVVRKKGNRMLLIAGDGQVIYSEVFKDRMAIVNAESIRMLADDRFVFQRPSALYLLSSIGKVLAELPCDTLWSYTPEIVYEPYSGTMSIVEESKKTEEHQFLLDNKLLKIIFEDKVYYYNFEKLISYKK